MNLFLDGVSPLERIQLSAQVSEEIAALASAGALERVQIAGRISTLLEQLGAFVAGADAGQEAFDRAKAFYRDQLQGQIVQSVVGPVRMTGKGWRKAKFGLKEDELKARLIEHIVEILEHGTPGRRREPYKDRPDGMVAFYFIQKDVQIDDQMVTAGVTVGEDAQGNLFYNVAHSAAKGWVGKEDGVLDSAWIEPRFIMDAVEAGASVENIADDELNIIILAVVPLSPQGNSASPPGAPALPLYARRDYFHGTALPFTSFAQGARKGSGYDHQGQGFYLTTDKRGYARFFAMQAADRVLNGPNPPGGEDGRLLEAGGVILDVQLSAAAKIIDLTSADAPSELVAMVADVTNGQALRDKVLALGCDGIAFVEPNTPEGVPVKAGAVTVALYAPEKASIPGFEEAGTVPVLGLDEMNEDQAQVLIRSRLPQKGGLLVVGDVDALDAYAQTYMDQAKYKKTADGLLFTKAQARMVQYLPVAKQPLPTGAVIYTYADPDGVSVAMGREISGVARNLVELKGLLAEDWGPEKFRSVFGEDAAPEGVQAYQDNQAAIAKRKQDQIDEAEQAQADQLLAQEQEKQRRQAEAEETARIIAQQDADNRADFEKTIGAGKVENPIYQAYLNTLETLPVYEDGNAAFLGWATMRAGEFEKLSNGRVSANRDAYVAYVRSWADQRLSERVKSAQIVDTNTGQESAPGTVSHSIVEHVTKGGKGKTLRGIIRTDLTFAQAKAIDEYTFRKDGGFFIREKHLTGSAAATQPSKLERLIERRNPENPEEELRRLEALAQAAADRLANNQLREVEKRAQQVTKLRNVAASTLEKAEETLNASRNTNTARRASMAASALSRAEADRAISLTINNLADAIERGQAKHLSGITSRAAVVSLQETLRSGMYEADRAAKLTYAEEQAQRGRAPTENDVKHAKFPMPMWGSAGTSLQRVLEAIKGKRGGPELTRKIRFSPGPDAEMFRMLKAIVGDKEANSLIGWWNVEQIAKVDRLRRAGINGTEDLRNALSEYLQFREGARPEDPVAKAERAIIGQKVGIDFFPTPKGEAARMAGLARVQEGDEVLEPSAGNGNLADAARAAGANVDVIEISSQLRDILEAKGHTVVATDFDTFTPTKQYDAVIMNPPFSARKDAEHIMRAFSMLKPGGRLVAIAGEGVFFGSDAKAQAFRDWLDLHGAEVEKLGEGTFMDKSLLATTGANARLIVLTR